MARDGIFGGSGLHPQSGNVSGADDTTACSTPSKRGLLAPLHEGR
jgi:hypothetical protein